MATTLGVPALRRLAAGLTVLTFAIIALMPATPHAQANCDWYGRTAVRQQQINEEMKCGFKGEAWHKDLGAHVKWCTTVAPDAWKQQAQSRNQQLAECEKKRGS